ncbi:hypothetical protein [Nonomuraea antimicrobica]
MINILAHAGFTGHDDTDVLEGRFTFGLKAILSGLAVRHELSPSGRG